MHYRALGQTGLNVSVLSLGGSPLGGAFRQTDDTESIRTVHTAFDLGVNLVDVSPYYALVSGGVRWDFKLDLRLFPFPDEWYGMFKPFIGLKTSY